MPVRAALLCSLVALASCAAQREKSAFIDAMVAKHRFSEDELEDVFAQVKIRDDVLKKIAFPAEAMPWHKYWKIFLTDARIKEGAVFWRLHADTLKRVSEQYGVPPEIIVAVLGVETLYGRRTGYYRVIDALSTLAFAYPPRSPFFSKELEQFLLLCREEKVSPLQPSGSYAGAMGMPQFMPSSFRIFAADFDRDGKRDLWRDPKDAIASIASYFKAHGWARNQPVAVRVFAKSEDYKALLNDKINRDLRIDELESARVEFSRPLPLESKVKLLAFEQERGDELWAVLDNFSVIKRYNQSSFYAMAVYQLSQALLNYRNSSPYE
ncbi:MULTISPECIES: lytic murein transglycosylase B [Methylomicrobium]|uniref:Lytic murein transglycosylase B n=1 Tax=Methylomicrobium album BG8 TaxID=686340 RepID=H8GQE0_METAL|nr:MULTISPECIES: lytic murein transglycosylase B [Methylomicrobium]EIC28599.1 lytic murein transglycosylase B [Methylomicrobium album BG8]